MSILLADDDAQLATFLSKSLESEGYSVHTALDEQSVLDELRRQNYKLIILDLNFGESDGLKLLEKLRAEGLETPVMVLSARERVSDRIQSLNLGADDYITKPFSFQELAARANAILRRKADPSLSILRVEDLEMDPATRKVHRGPREIKLSNKEFDLLHALMRRAGETVSRAELRGIWGVESETDSNLVDVYINYLRKKVDASGRDKLIYTVRGSGYRLGRPARHGNEPLESPAQDFTVDESTPEAPVKTAEELTLPETPLRALLYSIAHDLAQPLTSVRFFLEMLPTREAKSKIDLAEVKTVEQQADRAAALAKGISAIARETAVPAAPWTPLNALLDELMNDFSVLVNSGLLSFERRANEPILVSSSPVLRQLLVALLSKIVGRNAGPMHLAFQAAFNDDRCQLQLKWSAAGRIHASQPEGRGFLSRESGALRQMAHSFGADVVLPEGKTELTLQLPAIRQPSKQASIH